MTSTQAQDGGYIINKKFYYGPSAVESEMIQLITTKGPSMRYGTNNNNVIDFPGEFDVNNEIIRCWEANGSLSFLVRSGKKSFAVLSNKEMLDVGSFDDVDTFYCVDQDTVNEIERMEMSGDVKIIGEEEASQSQTEETEQVEE